MVTSTPKKHILFVYILVSIIHFNMKCFNPKQFIKGMWNKPEHESIHKDYPLSENSIIQIDGLKGRITVKPWNQKKVIIEADKEGTAEELKNTTVAVKSQKTPDLKGKHFIITTRVTDKKNPAFVHYNLIVPEDCLLILHNEYQGTIKVKKINGAIDATTNDGDIEITDSIGSIKAKTNKGIIKVKHKKLAKTASIFLENIFGDIMLILPRSTQANLHARTLDGIITSQHVVTGKFEGKLTKDFWDKMKRDVSLTLGSDAETDLPPITLQTNKGNIAIDEY